MCRGHVVADVVPAPSMSFPAASRPEALPRQDAGFVPEFSCCQLLYGTQGGGGGLRPGGVESNCEKLRENCEKIAESCGKIAEKLRCRKQPS